MTGQPVPSRLPSDKMKPTRARRSGGLVAWPLKVAIVLVDETFNRLVF